MADEIEIPNDRDAILELMRKEGLQVVHSMFATIYHKSELRPDGFSEEDLDRISDQLVDSDLYRWQQELRDHFAKKQNQDVE